MAQIPLGEFAQARVIPRAEPNRVDLSPTNIAGRGAAAIGDALQGAGQVLGNMAARQKAEAKQKADALARVDMMNSGSSYEIEVAAANEAFAADLAAGRVDWRSAGDEWGSRLSKIQTPAPPPEADEVMSAQFAGALQQTRDRARLKVDGLVTRARQAHLEAGAVEAINRNVMAASLPGGNADAAVARNNAMRETVREAGYDEAKADEFIRKANQSIYSNEVKGRVLAAGEDVAALNGVLHDLTAEDGRYTTSLDDPNQRFALASAVRQRVQQIEASAVADSEKRETAAARIVGDVWRNAESGLAPTVDMLTGWASVVKGTRAEGEFVEAVKAIDQVRGMAVKPEAEQAAYIQGLRADLANGASPEQLQRVDNIERVLIRSNEQRETQPLLWMEGQTGKPVPSVDMGKLLQSGSLGELGGVLNERMDQVTLLRSGYGPGVSMTLLKPQEAAVLSDALRKATTEQKLTLISMMASTASPPAYRAVMAQVAKGEPAVAYAGVLWAQGGERGQRAARLVLVGQEGDAKAFKMPTEEEFTDAFHAAVGAAYRGRPGDLAIAREVARSAYRGAAFTDGDTSGLFDADRLENVIKATLGETVDFNGRGEVFVPYGMDPDDFEDRVESAWGNTVARGLQPGALPDLEHYGLEAVAPGTYRLTLGRSYLYDAAGKPVELRP